MESMAFRSNLYGLTVTLSLQGGEMKIPNEGELKYWKRMSKRRWRNKRKQRNYNHLVDFYTFYAKKILNKGEQ